jgi:hypothetical protein
MELEPREKEERSLICLVGENQSNKAYQNNWSWQRCQEERRPRLCAIQLFEALQECSIDPYDMERVKFRNLWNFDGDIDYDTVEILYELQNQGYSIIGMGNKVQKALNDLEIEHIGIIHPAARGIMRRRGMYIQHIKEIFENIFTFS